MSQLSEKIFKTAPHYLTSPFGYRVNPVTGVRSFHNGTDYGTHRKNVPIYGVEEGVVYATGNSPTAGLYVLVDYPRLNVRMYHYHLSKVSVKKGTKVSSNTELGVTGTTGQSTGIHLHLGVYDLETKKFVNPDVYEIPPQIVITARRYVVMKGDTLGKIAQKYNTTVRDIANLNGIKNVNIIHVGQLLQIPSGQATHIVKRGENLTTIARKYGVTVDHIVKKNRLANKNLIFVGQKLEI